MLLQLGCAARLAGETDRATTWLTEGLGLLREIGGHGVMRQILAQLAGLAAENQPVRAAWLYGAAGPLRGIVGAPIPTPVREDDEHDRAAVRARLGAARFATAHDVGAATPLDEAVSYALASEQLLPATLAALEAEVARQPAEEAGSALAATMGARRPDGLTAREVEVLRLLAAGHSNQQIAEALVISPNTVIRHVSNIFDKTDVANRAEAASYAHRHGLAN